MLYRIAFSLRQTGLKGFGPFESMTLAEARRVASALQSQDRDYRFWIESALDVLAGTLGRLGIVSDTVEGPRPASHSPAASVRKL